MRWGFYSHCKDVCSGEGAGWWGLLPGSVHQQAFILHLLYSRIALGTRGQPRVGENLVNEGQSSVTTAESEPGEQKEGRLHRCGDSRAKFLF